MNYIKKRDIRELEHVEQSLLALEHVNQFASMGYKARSLKECYLEYKKVLKRSGKSVPDLEPDIIKLENDEVLTVDCFMGKLYPIPFDKIEEFSSYLFASDGTQLPYPENDSVLKVGNETIGQVWINSGETSTGMFSPRHAIRASLKDITSMFLIRVRQLKNWRMGD